VLQFLLSILLILFPLFAESAEPARLQMEIDRDSAEVHPREDVLGVRLGIHHADGRPVSGARLKIQLKAPDTPWLGSTDFPVVEGTALLNQELHVTGASHAFQFVPPIRGTYTLTASVEPLAGDSRFTPTQNSWQITINESPARKKNLALLLTILIMVGGISGFVIGRRPRSVAIPVLLLLLWPHEPLNAHGSHQHAKPSAPPTQTLSSEEGGSIDLEILTPEPRVGELTALRARYRDQHGQAQAAQFHLEVMQLEHERLVFSTDITASDGTLHWQGQFFDGSTHRVSVTAVPQLSQGKSGTAIVERDVDVSGVEPPLSSVIKSFGLLMFITALALLLGILTGRCLPLEKGGLT
jgi:hypothetical protein